MDDDRRSPIEMRWVPVTDERGRRYMESVWVVPAGSVSAVDAAAHAA